MVKRNEYPKKNYVKDDVQAGQPAQPASQQKVFQKDGDFRPRENHVRNTRPPRDNQQRDRDNTQQRDNTQRDNTQQQRETQKKEYIPRENGQRDSSTSSRELSGSKENQHRENNHQRNYHRENSQNREGREPYRQHYQRPAIKPRAEETVEDIAADILRVEKEIDLELKEIRSMRLGV